MNDYDANGKKIGHSSPSFFGGMNHYDNNGHKVGESRPGFFGGLNHYDDKGHKRGHSNPGFLGGFNHYFAIWTDPTGAEIHNLPPVDNPASLVLDHQPVSRSHDADQIF